MTRNFTLPRKLISALGAVVIGLGAITASSAPAQANGNDVAKVVAGVTALAILGAAINKSNKAEARPAPGWHQPQPPRHGAQRPHRPPQQQSCVQSGRGGQIVCGQPVGRMHNRPGPQPPRHGWNNSNNRHNQGGFYSHR